MMSRRAPQCGRIAVLETNPLLEGVDFSGFLRRRSTPSRNRAGREVFSEQGDATLCDGDQLGHSTKTFPHHAEVLPGVTDRLRCTPRSEALRVDLPLHFGRPASDPRLVPALCR